MSLFNLFSTNISSTMTWQQQKGELEIRGPRTERYIRVREGCRKKNPYFWWSFAKPGGGGSARVVKNHTASLKKYFLQRACRIILVPPKHVLHLVWSPYVIYTAIRTALKVACKARILGKRRSISKNKKIKFWNGTKRKICFTHLWSYFRKKNRGNFFYP